MLPTAKDEVEREMLCPLSLLDDKRCEMKPPLLLLSTKTKYKRLLPQSSHQAINFLLKSSISISVCKRMHKTNNEGTNLGIWQIPMRHTLTKNLQPLAMMKTTKEKKCRSILCIQYISISISLRWRLDSFTYREKT